MLISIDCITDGVLTNFSVGIGYLKISTRIHSIHSIHMIIYSGKEEWYEMIGTVYTAIH